MDLNYPQTQFELFPGGNPAAGKSKKRSFLFASLTLSIENIVVIFIVVMMVMVFCFSLGVESAKRSFLRSALTPSPLAQAPEVSPAGPSPVVKPTPSVVKAQVVPVKPQTTQSQEPSISPQTSLVIAKTQDFKTGAFTVQVASFKQEKFAKKEATLLKQKGYEIFIVPKGAHSIVCVGKFLDKGSAQNFSGQLKRKYKDCVIRRL